MRTSHLRTATAGGVLVLLTAGAIALATTDRQDDAAAATPVPTAVPEASVAAPSASPSPVEESRDEAAEDVGGGAAPRGSTSGTAGPAGSAGQQRTGTAPRTDSGSREEQTPTRPSPAPTPDRPPTPGPSPSPEPTDDRGPLGELVDSLLGR